MSEGIPVFMHWFFGDWVFQTFGAAGRVADWRQI